MSVGKGTPPHEINLESLCRAFTETNIRTLGGYATGEQTEAGLKLEAIKLLLAYGHGKPKQPKEHTGPEGGPIQLLIRDLVEEARAAKKNK